MRLYAIENYGCTNPSGIVINLGYYALCECLEEGNAAGEKRPDPG